MKYYLSLILICLAAGCDNDESLDSNYEINRQPWVWSGNSLEDRKNQIISFGQQGHYDIALGMVSQLLEDYENDSELNFMAGNLMERKSTYLTDLGMIKQSNKKSEFFFEKAYRLDPDNILYKVHYAGILHILGDHKKSFLIHEKILKELNAGPISNELLINVIFSTYVASAISLGGASIDIAKNRLSKLLHSNPKNSQLFAAYIELVALSNHEKAVFLVSDYFAREGYSEVVQEVICFQAKKQRKIDYAMNCYIELRDHPETSPLFRKDASLKIASMQSKE